MPASSKAVLLSWIGMPYSSDNVTTASCSGWSVNSSPVVCNGEPSGVVCSGTLSPSLNVPIGTCYLPTAHAKPGSELGIDIRGKIVKAEVVKTPFYKNGSHL